MKILIATSALLLILPTFTAAQDATHKYRAEGYIFIGEGLYSEDNAHFGISHVGGGGEVLLFRGLAVGGELGAMGRPGDGVGLFSVGPSYHFLRASSKSKLVPFVDGGYTRPFGNDTFTYSDNLFNFGGGFHYWVFKRVGLRVEFRDYVDHGFRETSHFPAIRIGLALR